MSEDPDDRTLLARTAAGDDRAFEELVRRYEGPLYRFLRRVTGSAVDAEDCRQQALVRIYQGAGRFRDGEPRVWLFRLAYRVALNQQRGARRRHLEVLEGGEELCDGQAGPLATAAFQEDRTALRAALKFLSPEDQALLWLRVAEGLPLHEVARVLDRPGSTLRYRLARALQALADDLGARGVDHDKDSGGNRHAMR